MRQYLLKTKGICSECGQGNIWNNKSLTLQLDHVDGNNDNWILTNLRLLCPNCHTQTPTWCNRNIKNTKRNSYLRRYKKENKQSSSSKEERWFYTPKVEIS